MAEASQTSSVNRKVQRSIWFRLVVLLVVTLIFSVSFWDFAKRHAALLFVFIGVVGELLFESKPEDLKDGLKLVFGIVLVIGLAWEIPNAAKADREASDKDELVERLRHSNLELLTKVKPRRISLEQKQIFIKLTKNVPRTPIRVFVGLIDLETHNFSTQVKQMLDEAGFGGVIVRNLDLAGSEPIHPKGFDDKFYEDLAKGHSGLEHPFDWDVIFLSYPTNRIQGFLAPLGQYPTEEVKMRSVTWTPDEQRLVKVLKHPEMTVEFHSTNVLSIPFAVSTSLSQIGLRVVPSIVTNLLNPGEFAIFIPQRLR